MEEEFEALSGPVDSVIADFADIETRAKTLALSLAAQAVETMLNRDSSDYKGPSITCPCGGSARYISRRPKILRTVLGLIRLSRAYYHCSSCGRGFCPRDQHLGVVGTSLSPGVHRMVALVGASVSFEEGSELLRELAGVSVPPKLVERTAEALGRELEIDEAQHPGDAPPRSVPDTLYLGIDGTGIPMRSAELKGRAGKQPDGSARTREVKLCTVWSAESRDNEGRPVRDPGSVTYTAAIESAASSDTAERLSPFACRVAREAQRRGFDRAHRQVILGDGAPFIWNIAGELFPDAIQIIDRFHVKQHLHEVSKAIWGPLSPFRHQWAHDRCEELDRGDIEAILQRLDIQAPTCDEARLCANYIRTNRHRMRYDVFHSMGLCTSTGIVEAACKHVIGTRLKRPGMHWSLAGANAVSGRGMLRS